MSTRQPVRVVAAPVGQLALLALLVSLWLLAAGDVPTPAGEGAGHKLAPGDVIAVTVVEGAENKVLAFRPGDTLRVFMQEDAGVSWQGQLPPAGRITLRYIGEVQIAGKTEAEVTAVVKTALEKDYYHHATVVVEALARPRQQPVHTEGTVPEAGVVAVPVVGNLSLTGMTAAECQTMVEQLLEQQHGYQDAKVTVRVVRRAPGRIVIYGAVKQAGSIELPEHGSFSILQALAEVGGLTSWARPEKAYIRRRNPKTGRFDQLPVNLVQLVQDPNAADELTLQRDDMIFVPAANNEQKEILSSEPAEVIVTGQVAKPGIIQFAPGERRTVMRAILKCGGFTKFAKKNKVRLIRVDEDNQRQVTEIDVSEVIDEGFLEKDVDLEPGDMIIVGERLFVF